MPRRPRRRRTSRPPLRRPRRRPVRTLTRKARRAIRRRLRRTAHKARARLAAIRQRHRARQLEIQRAATDLTARSITGKPRPAKATAAPARPATATVPAGAAPMAQRVKRSRDGKFNGSTGASKKTTGKKTAAKKATALTPEARKAAATQRALAAGNNRVARIDQHTENLDRLTIELFKATRLRDELNNTGPNRNSEQIRQLDAHIKQLSARYWPAYFDDMRRKERNTPPANG